MRNEDFKNWTRDMLKDRIIELRGIIEQWKRDNEKMLQITEITKKENDELKAENTDLRQLIKDLEDIGNNYEPQFARYDESEFNYECAKKWTTEMGCKRKIQELQDQHQQDCIKINQLHVTIDTLVEKYSRLRKTVGMD